ncbi:carboxypeptidase-like regulatory domain-containing protein [Chitinophaga sancti]|uniref:Carboxypeptidase-like regulatory domain-containing protein n=1 Tax=Chitinophaga sancti TaxID=1004 RepID=A0ABZ0XAM0_9BACT|nr:carboxypeptidase-like regulatory domain-containing protein [Chitinophaga sancti]WQG87354.1 carboxypeptidase-like regulatory domain-containing protein [Chitinophaga sancti]
MLRLSPLLLLLAATACKKIISAETVNPVEQTPTAPSSFQGRILDASNSPIADATVFCSGQSTTTDADGNFVLSNVLVDTNAAVITVKKNGYLNGVRTLMAHAYGQQYLEVALAPKDLTTSFQGSAVGNIGFTGMNIVFSPNQIYNSSNQVYKGTVSVAVDFIVPSDHATRMAGDLRGIDNNGQQVGLIPYGQVAIDLLDTNNVTLHPDAAHLVNVTMTIPGPYRESAPAQIGLFYLDTISGYWKQETLGYKQGSSYTGNIRQGTRWLFAGTYSQVTLDANIFQESGRPVSNLLTTIATKIDFLPTFSYTNADGHYIGKVAMNQPLILTLTDHCGNLVFRKEIGPYTANSIIDTLKTDNLSLCHP